MPEDPPRREDDAPREDPLLGIARGVGAMVNFVTNVAGQIAAASQPPSPGARSREIFRSNFRPTATPDFSPGLRPYGSEQRLAVAGREPLIDLFDEGAEVVVVVEWPDGDVEQIEVSAHDDVLALSFSPDAPAVDLLLPGAVDPASLRRQARNGIAEIRLRRA